MNLAWQFVTQTNVSVFLTGKAGTGKTTFLRKLREMSPKRMVVLAPTGVAAINAQGQTIHSFFQLPFGPIVPGMERSERRSHYSMSADKKNLIRTLDLLVIDEISMVRCDLLDAVDQELRKYRDRYKPFGGVQLLLIGDLQQLAPVAKDSEWTLLRSAYQTPYFFDSRALQQIRYVTIELKHIYRQQDETFINILAKIRNNNLDAPTLQRLNQRYVPQFVPGDEDGWIRLTTHNNTAHAYNQQRLEALKGEAQIFLATVKKNFPETSYPADERLELKVGAQVMFIKNDPSGNRAYYNGKIGIVRGWDADEETIEVWSKEDGTSVNVPRVTWENTKYVVDEETKDIREVVDGTFTQYPLRLAWAITVHKSQGLTFDHAVLDINDSFAHGQVYVALSRCRTLEGLVLARPLDARSVITDSSVNSYIDHELSEAETAKTQLPQMMFDYNLALLGEMFDFGQLDRDLRYLTRVVEEHLYGSYSDLLSLLKTQVDAFRVHVSDVAGRFRTQYQQMASLSHTIQADAAIQERIKAAAGYFGGKLSELISPVLAESVISIGNKQVLTQYNNALDALKLSYKTKVGIFSRLHTESFSVKNYLDAKAKAVLDELMVDKSVSKKSSAKGKSQKKSQRPAIGADVREESMQDAIDEMLILARGGHQQEANVAKETKKAAKPDTKQESLRMWREGLSIEQIAERRGFVCGTIAKHLGYFVEQGELSVTDLVPPVHIQLIQDVLSKFDRSYGLREVKELLPEDITYEEIQLVISSTRKQS